MLSCCASCGPRNYDVNTDSQAEKNTPLVGMDVSLRNVATAHPADALHAHRRLLYYKADARHNIYGTLYVCQSCAATYRYRLVDSTPQSFSSAISFGISVGPMSHTMIGHIPADHSVRNDGATRQTAFWHADSTNLLGLCQHSRQPRRNTRQHLGRTQEGTNVVSVSVSWLHSSNSSRLAS
jgi:hypothetical protein